MSVSKLISGAIYETLKKKELYVSETTTSLV